MIIGNHILVAGSNLGDLELVKSALADLDYLIVPAPTMSLALFLAQKNRPRIIIACPHFADGDVTNFARELKADTDLEYIPLVILLNAEAAPSAAEIAKQTGALFALAGEKPLALRGKLLPLLVLPAKERRRDREETSE